MLKIRPEYEAQFRELARRLSQDEQACFDDCMKLLLVELGRDSDGVELRDYLRSHDEKSPERLRIAALEMQVQLINSALKYVEFNLVSKTMVASENHGFRQVEAPAVCWRGDLLKWVRGEVDMTSSTCVCGDRVAVHDSQMRLVEPGGRVVKQTDIRPKPRTGI